MISQLYNGWFTVALVNERHFTYEGNKVVKKPLSEMLKYSNPLTQVPIIEGHDESSYFWIMPVKHAKKDKGNWRAIDEYHKEEISIAEDDVLEFLYYFLDKYYDKNCPYGECLEECFSNEFKWNLEYNIYTYDSMQAMIDDVRHMTQMLLDDYDNPELDLLKSRFRAYSFGGGYDIKKEDEPTFIKANNM